MIKALPCLTLGLPGSEIVLDGCEWEWVPGYVEERENFEFGDHVELLVPGLFAFKRLSALPTTCWTHVLILVWSVWKHEEKVKSMKVDWGSHVHKGAQSWNQNVTQNQKDLHKNTFYILSTTSMTIHSTDEEKKTKQTNKANILRKKKYKPRSEHTIFV